MKLLFLLFPFVYLCGNAYLFWRSLQAFSRFPRWVRVIWSALFWIAAFSLFASVVFKDVQLPYVIPLVFFKVGAVWMAFLLYMVLMLLAVDLIRLFGPELKGGFWYCAALVVLLLAGGSITYHHPEVVRMEMDVDKDMCGDGVRIVAISDVHLGYGTGTKALGRYVDLINSQSPDMVLIAGDMIDNSVVPLLERPFDRELSRIEAPVYIVPGNHEYISGIEECEEYLSKAGLSLLRDSVVTAPGGVQIVGRDDVSRSGRLPLETLLASTDPSKPVIVLDHQPYELSHADSLGVDIQISGHTHAGQIWPLTMIVDRMYDQSRGYRKWNHAHVWVSSGLSLWGPPFRIGSRSDLAVIDVKGRRLCLSDND